MRLLPAAILLSAMPVAAHAQTDGQAWGAVVAQGTVKGDAFVWLEAQGRFTDDASRLGQVILRPAAGVRFAPDSTVLAGYAYVPTTPLTGATTREHRLWQQVQLPLLRDAGGRPVLISRTRLEQRMVEGGGDTGWRLRQFVRLQLPIAREGAVQAVAFSEAFLGLNDTDWGARGGLDQWRNFIGIGVPVGERFRLEPGYLNQRIIRPGADRTNHVFSATLFYRI